MKYSTRANHYAPEKSRGKMRTRPWKNWPGSKPGCEPRGARPLNAPGRTQAGLAGMFKVEKVQQ